MPGTKTFEDLMLRSGAALLLAAALLLGGCSRVSITPGAGKTTEEAGPPWGYEGEMGPSRWADTYPACGGQAQSPIDVVPSAHADLPALDFEYRTIGGTVRDTGFSLQVDTEGGAFTYGDSVYTLLQFHFHVPGEHAIESRRYDAVMHLVHAGDGGRLAVVAVMYELGEENDFIDDVLAAAAAIGGDAAPVEIDVENAAPDDTEYFTYSGSLTTPPCTEGVTWFVLRNPESISEEQLAALAAFYRDNVRPLQPVNGRTILHSAG